MYVVKEAKKDPAAFRIKVNSLLIKLPGAKFLCKGGKVGDLVESNTAAAKKVNQSRYQKNMKRKFKSGEVDEEQYVTV